METNNDLNYKIYIFNKLYPKIEYNYKHILVSPRYRLISELDINNILILPTNNTNITNIINNTK